MKASVWEESMLNSSFRKNAEKRNHNATRGEAQWLTHARCSLNCDDHKADHRGHRVPQRNATEEVTHICFRFSVAFCAFCELSLRFSSGISSVAFLCGTLCPLW